MTRKHSNLLTTKEIYIHFYSSLNPDTLCRACDYKNAAGKRCTTSWAKSDIEYVPSTNIGPKDVLPCIVAGSHYGKGDERVLCAMMWSMIPPWHEVSVYKQG